MTKTTNPRRYDDERAELPCAGWDSCPNPDHGHQLEERPVDDRRNRVPLEAFDLSWGRLVQLASSQQDGKAGVPLVRVDYLTEIIQQAEVMRGREIARAREAGESWAKIGAMLGLSKQAAQQRYGKKS